MPPSQDVNWLDAGAGRKFTAGRSAKLLAHGGSGCGTEPQLQMLLGDGEDEGVNQIIERQFAAWAKAVDLPGKLRTMRQARAQDGEAFALLFNNGNLDSPVTLDFLRHILGCSGQACVGLGFWTSVTMPGWVKQGWGAPAKGQESSEVVCFRRAGCRDNRGGGCPGKWRFPAAWRKIHKCMRVM